MHYIVRCTSEGGREEAGGGGLEERGEGVKGEGEERGEERRLREKEDNQQKSYRV